MSFSAAEVTRVRRGARMVSAVLAIMFTLSVTTAFTPATPTASAADCPDIEVVFARGTNDAPGLGNVGGAFVDALRGKVGGRSVGAYAVNYPASFDFLAAAGEIGRAHV